MSRVLALCADDYGGSSAIDRGVTSLVQAGRLSEVSCLVNTPRWAASAPALAACAPVRDGLARVGLHVNLTEGAPLSPSLARLWPRLPPLPRLIALAHLRQLPLAAIADELAAQRRAFEHAWGRAPDHIDGHQHVHHLPGIRALVLALLARDDTGGPRLRHTSPALGPRFATKRRLIESTGGTALARQPLARQRAANAVLLGVYDFRRRDYRTLMQGWLAALPERGALLLCHPAQGSDAAPGDAIAAARQREWAYLASDAFADDLAAADVRLARRPYQPRGSAPTEPAALSA